MLLSMEDDLSSTIEPEFTLLKGPRKDDKKNYNYPCTSNFQLQNVGALEASLLILAAISLKTVTNPLAVNTGCTW